MSSRADRAVELVPEANIDALLVTDLINVRYLTGFTGSNGIAVLGPATRVFVTDFRYVEQATEQVDSSFDRRRAPQDLSDCVADALPSGAVRLGFEEAHMSVRQHAQLRDLLPDRVELVGVEGVVERLRTVKDPDEIELMRAAAQLADAALVRLLERGLVGRTERRIALELEQEMRVLGAQQPSFDSIVAAGAHGARPHASPRDVEIAGGQLVVIDWGAQLDGYCSDCTRTIAAGEPGDVAAGIYQLVLEAQLAGVAAIRPGAVAREVDGISRAAIEAGGQGERFGHGLGHGVGLEVHERPRLSQRSDDVLAAGNVVTVEPGVYLPGDFGVRIEDLVVVTDDGAEILSTISKELTVVD
ncbi:MAG TPA: Xaa-Pro peptidase family protein [Solirubrobacteraceae bacterium]